MRSLHSTVKSGLPSPQLEKAHTKTMKTKHSQKQINTIIFKLKFKVIKRHWNKNSNLKKSPVLICVLPVDYISQLTYFLRPRGKNNKSKELWSMPNWSRNDLHWAMFYANNRQYDTIQTIFHSGKQIFFPKLSVHVSHPLPVSGEVSKRYSVL